MVCISNSAGAENSATTRKTGEKKRKTIRNTRQSGKINYRAQRSLIKSNLRKCENEFFVAEWGRETRQIKCIYMQRVARLPVSMIMRQREALDAYSHRKNTEVARLLRNNKLFHTKHHLILQSQANLKLKLLLLSIRIIDG